MRALIAVFVLLVSACTSDAQVTPKLMTKAIEECASHGGLNVVTEADQKQEVLWFLWCGRYCSKTTGRVQYHVAFTCNDTMKMDLNWFE
jgi:hypothetical protein